MVYLPNIAHHQKVKTRRQHKAVPPLFIYLTMWATVTSCQTLSTVNLFPRLRESKSYDMDGLCLFVFYISVIKVNVYAHCVFFSYWKFDHTSKQLETAYDKNSENLHNELVVNKKCYIINTIQTEFEKKILSSNWIVCFISSVHIKHLLFIKHFTVCMGCCVTNKGIKIFARVQRMCR